MTSKAKSKGNSWERELAETLKVTFGGNWQRVPNSGAFTGGFNTFRKEFLSEKQIRLFKGDIIPADHMPKIVLECKFYADFPFHLLVKQDVPILEGWIQQTIESADAQDTWFLCMKFNRKGTYVLFDNKHLPHFQLDNHIIYKNYIFTDLDTFLLKNKDVIMKLCA